MSDKSSAGRSLGTQDELLEAADSAIFRTTNPAPMVLTRGQGVHVWDRAGKKYLDFTGGIAVTSVGHAHPKLSRAIAEQASRLLHVSNLFFSDRAIELAYQLSQRTHFDRFFFCNSGTEANEGLFKLARRFHHECGDGERKVIITAHGGFHGRSMGSLSLTAQPKYHVGLGDMLSDIVYVPFNDLEAVRALAGSALAAVLVEPIQGEGGLRAAEDEYLRGLRKLCDACGALLFFDEIQTGSARTGRYLAAEWSGVQADACSLAKGIAGGFPMGAIAIKDRLAKGLPVGSHGTTFGGNPMGCAAALAVLEVIDEEKLLDNTLAMGSIFEEKLQGLCNAADLPLAVEQRGRGLLQGLKLDERLGVRDFIATLRDHGLLVAPCGDNVLRFAPPLNVGEEDIETACRMVETCLRAQKS